MSNPRVLSIVGKVDASTSWRTIQPAEALAALGYDVTYIDKDEPRLGLVALLFDLIVLPRMTWEPAHLAQAGEWLAGLRQRGKVAVYEVDDDMFLHIDEHLTGAEERDQLERVKQAGDALRLCHAATVSVPRLATTVRAVTRPDFPVATVPNFIDLDRFDAARARGRRPHRGLTIGWVGAKRQESDVVPLAAAWRHIAQRHPRVRFVVAGHPLPALLDAVPPDRLTVLPWLPFERYPEHYAGIDIGCCAVGETPFNKCKSDIKAQEFGAAGAAVVASPWLYSDLVRDGDTGLLATTAEEWAAALDRLVTIPELRRSLGRRLRRRVEGERALARHAERWVGAWAWLRDQATRPQLWTPGMVA
jgi:glycosyltransferase involved in cell wall biosynthesis